MFYFCQASAAFPFDTSGIGMGSAPPGESSLLAVNISTPSSVTKRVCSRKPISRNEQSSRIYVHTELSSSFPIDGRAGPIVRPSYITILAERNHRFNGKGHAGFTFANGLVFGIVRHIRGTVEKLVNAVSAVGPNDAAIFLFRMLFDNVAKLADENTRFDGLNGLLKAFPSCFDNSYIVRVCLGPVADVVCFVQISMVAFVEERNIDIKNVSINKNSLVRNSVANNFVH